MCSSSGNLKVNVSSKPKNVVPRRKRTMTFADNLVGYEDEAVLLAKSGKQLKGVAAKDLTVQSLLDLRKGSKESILENDDDFDEGDDDAVGFGVIMYDKIKELPKFTPISPMVTCSSIRIA
nr:hypothetical protein [Tanacetum cinerariifolium]